MPPLAINSSISLFRVFVGTEDNLISRFLVDYFYLDGLGTLGNLFDHGSVAGIGEGGYTRVDVEVIERCKY